LNESTLLDCFASEKLLEIASRLDEEATSHNSKSDDYAPEASLMLLAGWLKAKEIAVRSQHATVVGEAKEHADLYYFHIKNLLRVVRGEPTSDN
jgi:hypothetical protein